MDLDYDRIDLETPLPIISPFNENQTLNHKVKGRHLQSLGQRPTFYDRRVWMGKHVSGVSY